MEGERGSAEKDIASLIIASAVLCYDLIGALMFIH